MSLSMLSIDESNILFFSNINYFSLVDYYNNFFSNDCYLIAYFCY
jgi:hypothetical protein